MRPCNCRNPKTSICKSGAVANDQQGEITVGDKFPDYKPTPLPHVKY